MPQVRAAHAARLPDRLGARHPVHVRRRRYRAPHAVPETSRRGRIRVGLLVGADHGVTWSPGHGVTPSGDGLAMTRVRRDCPILLMVWNVETRAEPAPQFSLPELSYAAG